MTVVEVVAPNDMSEGYQFDAEAEGQTFTATVPKGGAKAGEKISVEMADEDDRAVEGSDDKDGDDKGNGDFKHGLCSCFETCPFPCLIGWCCSFLLLGQIMQRLKFSSLGSPSSNGGKNTFVVCLILYILVFVLGSLGRWFPDNPNSQYLSFTSGTASIWFLIAMSKTRMAVREKHNIDGSCCCDCLHSWLCPCCTAIQLHRETHDEKEHMYRFTATGLAAGAPEMV